MNPRTMTDSLSSVEKNPSDCARLAVQWRCIRCHALRRFGDNSQGPFLDFGSLYRHAVWLSCFGPGRAYMLVPVLICDVKEQLRRTSIQAVTTLMPQN